MPSTKVGYLIAALHILFVYLNQHIFPSSAHVCVHAYT